MQKVLEPVIHRPAYTTLVQAEVQAWFDDVIFGPLFAMLKAEGVALDPEEQKKKFDEFGRRERLNATEALLAALKAGRVWYANGAFGSASFNAELSRELRSLGARYDRDAKVFVLAHENIPLEIRGTIDAAAQAAKGLHQQMVTVLGQMQRNIPLAPVDLRLGAPVDRILKDLSHQFDASVKGIEAITVTPELQPGVRQAITKELTENLELGIKNFADHEVLELRQLVEENLLAGGRLDRLAKVIESRYGVTKRKAEFLADNETSLLTAKFREERARNAGSMKYVWYTRHDNRVRHDHQELNGRTFFWSDPPIVDKRTARRAHPGEDYNCRCFARPIIELPRREAA